MEQYIDKDALVAEIEKEIKDIYAGREYVGIPPGEEREIDGLEKPIEILNTLEVKEIGVDLGDLQGDKSAKYIIDTKTLEAKEVDLEKEIEDHIKECLDIKFPTTDIELIKKDVTYTAKKFFELGIKAKGK